VDGSTKSAINIDKLSAAAKNDEERAQKAKVDKLAAQGALEQADKIVSQTDSELGAKRADACKRIPGAVDPCTDDLVAKPCATPEGDLKPVCTQWSGARQANASAKGARSAASENLTKAAQKLDAYESSLDASRRELKDAQDAASKNPDKNSVENKGDSFSVYGSFDAGGVGEKASLGFNIGKVFSTGVAAQHLTSAAKAGSVANCMAKASELAGRISEARREEFAFLATAACKN